MIGLCNHRTTPPRPPSRNLDFLSITLIKMAPCRFFARGVCRNGDSCNYIHELSSRTGRDLASDTPALPNTKLKLNVTGDPHCNDEAKPAQNCRFFLQGKCNKGKDCRYDHLTAILTSQQVHLDAPFVEFPQSPSDSRATVSCKFLSKSGGCQNNSCSYLYVADAHNAEKSSSQDLEANVEEASS